MQLLLLLLLRLTVILYQLTDMACDVKTSSPLPQFQLIQRILLPVAHLLRAKSQGEIGLTARRRERSLTDTCNPVVVLIVCHTLMCLCHRVARFRL